MANGPLSQIKAKISFLDSNTADVARSGSVWTWVQSAARRPCPARPCDSFIMDITKAGRTGTCRRRSAALIKDHVSLAKLREVLRCTWRSSRQVAQPWQCCTLYTARQGRQHSTPSRCWDMQAARCYHTESIHCHLASRAEQRTAAIGHHHHQT